MLTSDESLNSSLCRAKGRLIAELRSDFPGVRREDKLASLFGGHGIQVQSKAQPALEIEHANKKVEGIIRAGAPRHLFHLHETLVSCTDFWCK